MEIVQVVQPEQKELEKEKQVNQRDVLHVLQVDIVQQELPHVHYVPLEHTIQEQEIHHVLHVPQDIIIQEQEIRDVVYAMMDTIVQEGLIKQYVHKIIGMELL